MAVLGIKTFGVVGICVSLGLLLISHVEAASVQPKFQEAVQAKDCETVIKLFPDLVAENDVYYGTLSNFHEKGICLPQDYVKAYEALQKLPDDEFGFKGLKLGQYFLNGWGVPKDQKKAKSFFQQAIEVQLLRHEKFSDARIGLDIMLGVKELPQQLAEILSYYENLNWNPDQKYKYALGFIENGKSEKVEREAYHYLIRLFSQYNHVPSAYKVAKWYEEKQQIDHAKTYFLASARHGHAKAQAYVGRSYFFKNNKMVGQRVAYEMLYRAHLAGEVSEEEIAKAEQALNKWEIQWGREEAAKPLPAK